MLLNRNYAEMQKMGLKVTADELYSVNHGSLKDAIVSFGGYCTGEMISKEGLLITNHHCGYGWIQYHSSVEKDYLTNGFWALSKAEELPTPGLFVKFLVRMEDVTKDVLKDIKPTMTEKERDDKISNVMGEIAKKAINGTHYNADVKSFFDGNEYYLFVYETFTDVRLVGAPPSSIGTYGGDTDNWMWPRHTGDFSMFRVYMAKDGKPANYSKDNIPYQPKHFLPVSIKGVQDKDFSMIMGYPGATNRYLPSYGVNMAIEQTNPTIVKIRQKKLDLLKFDMDSDPKVKIQYASKYAKTSNYWKYYIGQTKGLKRLKIAEEKKATETEFTTWASKTPANQAKFGKTIADMEAAYAEIAKYNLFKTYYSEVFVRGTDILLLAYRYNALYSSLKAKDDITNKISSYKAKADEHFKDFNLSTDKKVFAALIEMFAQDVVADQKPEVFTSIIKKFNGDFIKYSDFVYENSIFSNPEKMDAFLKNPEAKTLENDPAFQLFAAVYSNYNTINTKIESANEKLSKANREYIAGLREMRPEKNYYPNANSTMRLTYGSVGDYFPKDAVHYNYFTTLKGVIEKEDPENPEFMLPKKIKELYINKEFGQYGYQDDLVVCFTTNNDITGGNSGSPVINANGELIGLAFDGNWEAMSGDIAFEPELQRCINVDIRYVLFIIDKYAGATNLINEMTIVKN